MSSLEIVSVRPPSPVHLSPSRDATPTYDNDKIHVQPASAPATVTAAGNPGPAQPRSRTLGARAFDGVTDKAGTPYAFGATMLAVGGWAVAGIVLKAPDNWQIAMQDGSSIQCYASDTLLMRQQRNQSQTTSAMLSAWLGSNATKQRLLGDVIANPMSLRTHPPYEPDVLKVGRDLGDTALPARTRLDRTADVVSNFCGSPYALGIYAAGIGAWLGAGPSLGFGNEWQLYINTAVATHLTLTSMFLQNTRRRHMMYVDRCRDAVQTLDTQLENRLRAATGDATPNPAVTVPTPQRNMFIRGVDGYSNLIASGVGAGVSACVFGTWLGLGSVMGYDNSNWWLIIGTYTGLVGFVDGFVLRNTHRRQGVAFSGLARELQSSDRALHETLNITFPEPRRAAPLPLPYRLSAGVSRACSSDASVAGSLLVVASLIGIASGMQWSETGQLLCNTPTMIVEGLLMLVLMQAHNATHAHKRRSMHDLLERRQGLLDRLDTLEACAA